MRVRIEDEPNQLRTFGDVKAYHISRLLNNHSNDLLPQTLKSSNTTLSGREAFTIRFHNPGKNVVEGLHFAEQDVLVITTFDPMEHRSYSVRYSAQPVLFAKYLKIFEKMTGSFEITK